MAERRRLAANWLEGREKDAVLAYGKPSNGRFTLFWDILKGRFGRLVFVNFLILLTALPVIGIMFFRFFTVSAQDVLGPFGAGLGIGYPAFPDVVGYAERTVFYSDILYFALFIPASAILAVGLSGGGYLIGNLLRTEGIFEAKDFLRGVRRNFSGVFEALLLFTVVLFLARLSGDFSDWMVAIGHSMSVWLIVSKIVGYILMSFLLLVCLWMIPLWISYKQNPFALIRNAFVMTVGTFPQTVLFAAAAISPIFLILFTSNTFLLFLGVVFYLTVGLSWMLLVWINFTQWAFDKFIPSRITTPNKSAGSIDSAITAAEKVFAEKVAQREHRRLILAQGKSKLMSRPMQPLDEGTEPYLLPEEFSREDLLLLRERRYKIEQEQQLFEDAHKGEEKYVEYNSQFEDHEKALSGEGKKKTPKRPPKMLKR